MQLGEKKICFFSFPDRGVGRSRNEAILRADSDICLFSDADIVYEDGYEEMIVKAFRENPKADMIVFNVGVEEERRTYHITQTKRVRWYNCGRYGAVSFAVRTDKLLQSGITFSLLFGGGAKYSNGEDSLFMARFIRKGYRVYTSPAMIAREVPETESTWFKGYNEKFFHDRGVLFHYLYGRLGKLMCLRYILLKRKKMCTEMGAKVAFGWMMDGIREGKGG
jgi:glycosyltransferase involved in cell wall biosynthesis